jgi:hypothetical protein
MWREAKMRVKPSIVSKKRKEDQQVKNAKTNQVVEKIPLLKINHGTSDDMNEQILQKLADRISSKIRCPDFEGMERSKAIEIVIEHLIDHLFDKDKARELALKSKGLAIVNLICMDCNTASIIEVKLNSPEVICKCCGKVHGLSWIENRVICIFNKGYWRQKVNK